MLKLAAKEHLTRDDTMQRYPRLVGHMICESLGYFTPESAANALASYIKGCRASVSGTPTWPGCAGVNGPQTSR